MSAILKDPLLRLRPMHESDLEAVAAVEREAYQFPWSKGIFRDCLRVGYCCWVCTRDGRVIGYGVMSVAVGESHILNVCVHPDAQGQGVGRGLMDRLLSLARGHNVDTAYLEVRPSNRRALALYRSLGFSQVGVRRAYYPAGSGREDALILAIAL
ncbi:MAG: ribosomal protein S18-alanine N-acetyltransferase [Chromatiales bacterium]|jgi:ribosomal-protein-alanine N-acetyltransferase